MATTTFWTIAHPVDAELTIKRSRFLCHLHPTHDETSARDVIAQIRSSHRDARHHCTGFILGEQGAVCRSNDDGEPSGTAGAPILEALRGAQAGAGVTNVTAVVTRWFGGIKLGTGGLTRAYGDAVRTALASAIFQQFALTECYTVAVGHDQAAKLEHSLRCHKVLVLSTEYLANQVTLTVGVPVDTSTHLQLLVNELTGADVPLVRGADQWLAT